jgi:hypothetical protein
MGLVIDKTNVVITGEEKTLQISRPAEWTFWQSLSCSILGLLSSQCCLPILLQG